MGDMRRWSVSYTKQVKQKRKVYHDGFLEIDTSTNRVILYDDCEKMLEYRLLKKDEIVSSGETLTFNAYLVDVNASDGEHESPYASNYQGRANKSAFKNNKILKTTLSPSQKIIRDFKKKEILKYGSSCSSPDATAESYIKEWEVLYTKQLTQKAKKYHDGFLQLKLCGSHGRQVLLSDTSRNLLDSRFLKKDEVIESGETIVFDAHLVEIGEYQVDNRSSREGNGRINEEAGILYAQYSRPFYKKTVEQGFLKNEVQKYNTPNCSTDTTGSSSTEWQVLYTTQLTQKAKKYHDGFLQLAVCGSREKKAMLYDSTRKLLDSRFLKKEEVIRSGESLMFSGHLVDIGEPERSNEHVVNTNKWKNNDSVQKTETMQKQHDCLIIDNVQKGNPCYNVCMKKDVELSFNGRNADKLKASSNVPENKPSRNAKQILSILQRPRTEKSASACRNDNNMISQVSPTRCMGFPEADQHKTTPLAGAPQHVTNENLDVMESRGNEDHDKASDLMPFKALSSHSGSLSAKDMDVSNPPQLSSDMKANTILHDEASTFNRSSFFHADEIKSFEELGSTTEKEGFPSFDLGF